MIVEFTNVGRYKKTWRTEVPSLTQSALLKAVKKANALASKGVEFTDDGQVIVGFGRPVGTWKVIESAAA